MAFILGSTMPISNLELLKFKKNIVNEIEKAVQYYKHKQCLEEFLGVFICVKGGVSVSEGL